MHWASAERDMRMSVMRTSRSFNHAVNAKSVGMK